MGWDFKIQNVDKRERNYKSSRMYLASSGK
jgi:hypothetical protein